MQLHNILDTKFVTLKKEGLHSKKEVIGFLLKQLMDFYPFPLPYPKMFELVLKRELSPPTDFQTGISIPHMRVPGRIDTYVAVCTVDKPIISETTGIPISMFTLIITSQYQNISLYLNTLAAFIRLAKNTEVFQELIHISDKKKFLQLIQKQTIVLQKALLVEDLMYYPKVIAQPSTLLLDIYDHFLSSQLPHIPVLDDKKHLLGDLHLDSVLSKVLGTSLKLPNLNFIPSLTSLDTLYEKSSQASVEEFMESCTTSSPRTSAVGALHTALQTHLGSLSVIEEGAFVGLFDIKNMLKHVLYS